MMLVSAVACFMYHLNVEDSVKSGMLGQFNLSEVKSDIMKAWNQTQIRVSQ